MEKCRLTGVVLPDDATDIVVQGYIEVLEGSKVANYDTADSHNVSLSLEGNARDDRSNP